MHNSHRVNSSMCFGVCLLCWRLSSHVWWSLVVWPHLSMRYQRSAWISSVHIVICWGLWQHEQIGRPFVERVQLIIFVGLFWGLLSFAMATQWVRFPCTPLFAVNSSFFFCVWLPGVWSLSYSWKSSPWVGERLGGKGGSGAQLHDFLQWMRGAPDYNYGVISVILFIGINTDGLIKSCINKTLKCVKQRTNEKKDFSGTHTGTSFPPGLLKLMHNFIPSPFCSFKVEKRSSTYFTIILVLL